MQIEVMDRDEVKTEAERQGFTEIRRDEENAPWVPLKTWNGFSGHTGTLGFFVQVDYYLEGNRVRVKRALDPQEYWYTLR